MKRLTTERLVLGAALALLVQGAAFCGAAPEEEFNDSVHMEDNSAVNVKITEDSWKGVTYQPRGENVPPITIDVSRVKGTEYADRVAEYEKGMEALRKREYAGAEEKLQDGLKKTKDKKQHQYFLVGLIEAAEAQGKGAAVRGYVERMIKISPAPRLVYDAYLKMGESHLREGNFKGAESAYGEAARFFGQLETQAMKITSAGLRGQVKRYQVLAKYWRIFCMEQQGKAKIEGREGAKRAYFLFEAEAGSNRTLLYRAKIGRARCDAVLGDHDKALKDLEALRKELEDPKNKDASAALAEVYVSLGDVYFLKLDYRQARWYYLTVIVRHANDRAMTARAHYKAGLCYEKLVEKARERQGLPRALRHYEIVVKEFQGCVEHKAAKERLESLKGRLGA